MRWLFVGTLLVAACGDTQTGALLTFDAPDGPQAAAEIEIVLADPAATTEVQGQRFAPDDFNTVEDARYYVQRAIAGTVAQIDGLDGFQIRIEPDASLVAQTDLIPFLLAYDDAHQLLGIGTVVDGNGEPTTITITDDQLIAYTVSFEKLSATTADHGLQPGESLTVTCNDNAQRAFDSGIAWEPGGMQLRLLFPDPRDGSTTDASQRPLDMDCDGAVAFSVDCDDLRAKFHDGAAESCDGFDFDCDGQPLEVVDCSSTATATCTNGTGVGVCLDQPDGAVDPATCAPDPACRCAAGTCAKCVIPFTGVDAEHNLCEPYQSNAVSVPGCNGGCTVEVIARSTNPWRIKISLPNGTPASKVPGVDGTILIHAEYPPDDKIVAPFGAVVGEVLLLVTPDDPLKIPVLVGFTINLEEQASASCGAMPTPMQCD